MQSSDELPAEPIPANRNAWVFNMETREAIVRHRRTLEPVPVSIVVRIAELKMLLGEVLETEALAVPKFEGRRPPWAEAKRRMAIVLRKEAAAELAALGGPPARVLVE